jgi:hypothetical protein
MTDFKKRLTAALSAGSLFFSLAAPAMAETTITISGNGASSTNTANVQYTGDTTVVQTNNAAVTNNISASTNTGGNDANQNTSGDVLIKTGDATTDVSVENILNSNHAVVDCCNVGDTDLEISKNGAYTDNDIKLKDDSDISLYQTNNAAVTNNVDADAKTGKNNANQNTGGNVAISTGDATSLVDVSTAANANYAVVGGDQASGSLSARILGNGYASDNLIDLQLDDDIALVQTNSASIYNNIDADAKTGKNNANQNTGGDMLIATGDATVDVEVDNMVNFNWANLDCGCVQDLLAKIGENGANTDNDIKVKLDNDQTAHQTNSSGLNNNVDGNAKTGKNDLNQNTGDTDGDPTIWTGDASSFVEVNNSGHVNSYGGDMPELPWDWDFDFHFSLDLDFSDLLALLG